MAMRAPKMANMAAGTPNGRYSGYMESKDKKSETAKNIMPIARVLLLENSPAIFLNTSLHHFSKYWFTFFKSKRSESSIFLMKLNNFSRTFMGKCGYQMGEATTKPLQA